jgi:hypothetical protein
VAVAPPGSTTWQYVGQYGQVTGLKYSFIYPGGCDQMSCQLEIPTTYRPQILNPGWKVRITRGGHQVWDGKMDEPVFSAAGAALSAIGTGNLGQDYLAIYTSTWPTSEPDQIINNAITRGLPWFNPGQGTPSGAWYGQAVDSAAQTVTDMLNLICTRGGLGWYVNSQPGGNPGDDLNIAALPSTPNRILVCTTPVSRTLGGDINTIYIRYEISADNSSGTTDVPAVYGYTSVQNAASVAAHGVMETFIDLSDVGVMTSSAAQAVASNVLAIYQRASFAGSFTVSQGQLLTLGGQPIDLGTEQAGTLCKVVLTDYAYGGEVLPNTPMQFIVGSYAWDDQNEVATVTPYQSVDESLTGLLSMENTVLTPITVAST